MAGHDSDDCFANLRLLADTAVYISFMENMGPLQRKKTSFDRKPKANLSESWFVFPPKAKQYTKRKVMCMEDDNDIDKTRKRGKKNTTTTCSDSSLPIHSPPQDVLALLHVNGGFDLKFLIRKRIYKSDVNPHLERLSIPCRQVKAPDFLTETEKEMVTQKNNKGIMVSLLIPSISTGEEVSFRQWDMNSSSIYVICGKWCNVIKGNILNEGEYIQIWSFRDYNGKLCLVLIKENQINNNTVSSSQSKSDITTEAFA